MRFVADRKKLPAYPLSFGVVAGRRIIGAGMRRTAECVWCRAARAPGPASACLHNPVVADILQMPVSTFASAFATFCMRSRHFGNCPS